VNKDGTRGFYARKGDVLLEYAIRYKVRYARLLEINGLPDAPLAADMFVSLEKGNRIVRIISRDASTPPPAATYEAPANKEVIRREEPVLANNREVPAEKAGTTNKTDNDLSDGKTLQPDDHGNPVGQMASPVAIPEKTPEIPDAKHISTATQKPAATTTAAELPIQKPAPPSEKPINIADEVAVEEIKEVVKPKAPEEPLDEFSRLKARLDKVVYAPAKTPAPKPAATQVAASPTIEKPVVSATPAVATAAGGKMYHTVKSGETAFGIARQYGISMKELMTMNDLNFQAIKIGQKLRVR
jgi:LysM repeat protein